MDTFVRSECYRVTLSLSWRNCFMGCDIHFYVERRSKRGWKLVEPPPRDLKKWPKITGHNGYTLPWWGPNNCMCDADDQHWYRNRNYNVFAILADVRNDGQYSPISSPRGEPSDMSSTLQPTWSHSETWLTLDEVLLYNWQQEVINTGIIPLRSTQNKIFAHDGSYESWRLTKRRPEAYSRAIGSAWITTIDMDTAERFLRLETRSDPNMEYYVRVSWTERCVDVADDFLSFIDEFVMPLGDPHDIRFVFGFDS